MASEKENLMSMGKDVLVSLLILVIILGSLYVFSGRWPPMVVIESGSMMHSQESQIGAIDPGDIVIVRESQREDITTYVEGKAEDYRKYGQYGDVIVFEPDGNERRTPIIHRPVLYLEYNETNSFDIPSLQNLEYEDEWETTQGKKWNGLTQSVTLHDYGYGNKEVTIDLQELLKYEHSGYITMGDSTRTNAPNYDQKGATGTLNEPVKEDWIKGKARGELPWFGAIKLALMGRSSQIPSNSWNNFVISLAVILLIPFITEVGSNIYRRTKEKSEDEETEPDKIPNDTEKEPEEMPDEEEQVPDETIVEKDVGERDKSVETQESEQEDTETNDLTEY